VHSSRRVEPGRRVCERNVIAVVGLARACRWCRPTDDVREPQNGCEETGGESAVVLYWRHTRGHHHDRKQGLRRSRGRRDACR